MARSSKRPGSRFSRRGFMWTGLGIATAWLLPIGSAAQAHDHQPGGDDEAAKEFTPGAPFVEPEVRSSANGQLNTTLRMQYAYKDIGGHRLYVRTYEGTVPGPTLRVKPGDVLRIKLINDMPPNRDPEPIDHSLPHQFNTTNLHTHGLHVSPSGISDNVMRAMEPGKSYDIEVAIPSDHIPGTNWYHPHMHGSADVQMASGAVGALIIEGDFAEVPEIAAAKERLLVLTEAVFDQFGMVEDFGTLFPETAARFLAMNGVREPNITMRPGEVQRWRVLHAGWQDDIFMELEGDPIWLDTTIVPRSGSITFRSRFLDFTGKFMLHCHMMNHEDLGMMQVVEVYADD